MPLPPRSVLVAAILAVWTATATHAAGPLVLVDQERNGLGGVVDLRQPEVSALSPDGRHLYVSSPIRDDILVFARDPLTGELTFVDDTNPNIPLDPNTLSGLAVSPDGAFVYATLAELSRVIWLSRNPVTGLLTSAGLFQASAPSQLLDGANEILISPDGLNLYVAASVDGAISVFTRNPATGALTFRASHQAEVGGVSVLAGVRGLALSPDGTSLYAVAIQINGGTVAFFTRRSDGLLIFRQRLRDNAAGMQGLNGANDVTVSPDGRFVYVAAFGGLAVLKRSMTGYLVLRTEHLQLTSLTGVTINRTGDRLYVTSTSGPGDGIFAYDRNVTGGQLALASVASLQDGVGGVDYLEIVQQPILSRAGDFVIAAAEAEDAVTTAATGDDGRLGLGVGGRFRIRARYTTQQGATGFAEALALSTDTGYMYFFDPENIELVIKVLDGCSVNQRYWVFIGGLTNVRVAIHVEDTSTGQVRTYVNPLNTHFVPRQDVNAFACP